MIMKAEQQHLQCSEREGVTEVINYQLHDLSSDVEFRETDA